MKRSALILLSAALGVVVSCSGKEERWATTGNTNVEIDMAKVKEAYDTAESVTDFENKVNEIYEGDEIIQVWVRDVDASTQEVAGFIDKNGNGKMDDNPNFATEGENAEARKNATEMVFGIKRFVEGGNATTTAYGYGPYYGYSPVSGMLTGMMMGMLISSAMTPSYRPMYTQPYTTNTSRTDAIRSHRSTYRASNPGKFSGSTSSGRSWGSSSGSSSSSSSSGRTGGGSFGLRRQSRRTVRLSA